MKKLLIFVLLIFILSSCSQQGDSEFVLMAEGNIENYLIIVDYDILITIKYDNREIDKDKLLTILELKPNMEISINESVEKELINAINIYNDNESCLAQVYIDNKKQLESKIEKIVLDNTDSDITEFLEKLDKQTAYCFDDIEEIKDSANNLALWLKQVRSLSRRKDL